MKAGTMPLPVDVETLPIYICERFRGEAFDLDRDFHTLLPVARGMNLTFWWVLLTYGMLVARQFGGTWAGRFAVVLLATEPNLLGHACLATTDIALASMVLVFAYHYECGRSGGRLQRWVVPGLLYGLAMAAKASALIFVPIVMVALELPRWLTVGGFREYRSDCWKIFLVGIAFVFLYCGSDWQPQSKWEQSASNLPMDGEWTPAVQWATHHAAVFPNAGEAFHYQFKHNVRGHGSYLSGEWHRRAVWYYFPVALAIKVSIPVLALLGGLLVFRPRVLCTSLGLAALLLLLFSLNCRVQIGVRLVFPLVVFVVLALAVALARCNFGLVSRDAEALPSGARNAALSFGRNSRNGERRGVSPTCARHTNGAYSRRGAHVGLTPRRSPLQMFQVFARAASRAPLRKASASRLTGCLTVLALMCVAPAVSTWPDGLHFSNHLWGGSDATHLYLSDSNADWGQGIKDLDRWTEANGLPPAAVWYYGTDPTIARNWDRCLPLHVVELYDLHTADDVGQHVRGKIVAVSTTLLYGNPAITESMPMAVEFFRGQQPIGRTRNFFIYDFRP